MAILSTHVLPFILFSMMAVPISLGGKIKSVRVGEISRQLWKINVHPHTYLEVNKADKIPIK